MQKFIGYCGILLALLVRLGSANIAVSIEGPEPFSYTFNAEIRLTCRVIWNSTTDEKCNSRIIVTWATEDYNEYKNITGNTVVRHFKTTIWPSMYNKSIRCSAVCPGTPLNSSATFKVQVRRKPLIRYFDKIRNIYYKDEELICKAWGIPLPNLTIIGRDFDSLNESKYHCGQEIYQVICTEYEMDGIKIKTMKMLASKGKFTCKAENSYGFDALSRDVSVERGKLNQRCTLKKKCITNLICQWSGDQYADIGTCQCRKGYTKFNNKCVPVTICLGCPCVNDEQCRRQTSHSTCQLEGFQKVCKCIEGFNAFSNICISKTIHSSITDAQVLLIICVSAFVVFCAFWFITCLVKSRRIARSRAQTVNAQTPDAFTNMAFSEGDVSDHPPSYEAIMEDTEALPRYSALFRNSSLKRLESLPGYASLFRSNSNKDAAKASESPLPSPTVTLNPEPVMDLTSGNKTTETKHNFGRP